MARARLPRVQPAAAGNRLQILDPPIARIAPRPVEPLVLSSLGGVLDLDFPLPADRRCLCYPPDLADQAGGARGAPDGSNGGVT